MMGLLHGHDYLFCMCQSRTTNVGVSVKKKHFHACMSLLFARAHPWKLSLFVVVSLLLKKRFFGTSYTETAFSHKVFLHLLEKSAPCCCLLPAATIALLL